MQQTAGSRRKLGISRIASAPREADTITLSRRPEPGARRDRAAHDTGWGFRSVTQQRGVTRMIAAESDSFAAATVAMAPLYDSLARIDGKARMALDRAGRIVAASACAPDRIAQCRGVAIERGVLRACDPAAQSRLTALLAVRGTATQMAIFGSREGQDRLLARSSAIDEDRVCLVLASAQVGIDRRIPELRSVFGLTDSEARIVAALADGDTLQTIAERRRNSIYTIRAHIRQCYQKLKVNSREQLLGKVLGLCV